jgi:hypothetical protein
MTLARTAQFHSNHLWTAGPPIPLHLHHAAADATCPPPHCPISLRYHQRALPLLHAGHSIAAHVHHAAADGTHMKLHPTTSRTPQQRLMPAVLYALHFCCAGHSVAAHVPDAAAHGTRHHPLANL